MTKEERWEARRLYRESGYRPEQIKILCELFEVSRGEILEVLAGMPTQKEAVMEEFRKGLSRQKIMKMFGLSETTSRRLEKKYQKEERLCLHAINANNAGKDATASAKSTGTGKRSTPSKKNGKTT